MADWDVLTVPEAAELLGVTRQRVQQMIEEGKLPARRFGRAWAIAREAVEARASR